MEVTITENTNINSLIGDLTYANYRWNRIRTPGISPKRWVAIYGEHVYTMERKYQEEICPLN